MISSCWCQPLSSAVLQSVLQSHNGDGTWKWEINGAVYSRFTVMWPHQVSGKKIAVWFDNSLYHTLLDLAFITNVCRKEYQLPTRSTAKIHDRSSSSLYRSRICLCNSQGFFVAPSFENVASYARKCFQVRANHAKWCYRSCQGVAL